MFLGFLELLVDEDPEKRKEGVRKMRGEVKPKALEERVERGKGKYDEIVKPKKLDRPFDYIASFAIGGVTSIWGVAVLDPELGGFLLLEAGGAGGIYLTWRVHEFINWHRRRKAEKAAGVQTIQYDLERRRGVKDQSLRGWDIGEDHYLISENDVGIPFGVITRAYRVIDYNKKKKKAKGLEITNREELIGILQQYHSPRTGKSDEKTVTTAMPSGPFSSSSAVSEGEIREHKKAHHPEFSNKLTEGLEIKELYSQGIKK